MISRLFVYGTLMYPELFEAITGVRVRHSPARLPGFERRQIAGKDYPGIIPNADASVSGVIYHRLDKAVLRLLDRYEDSFYQRIPATVLTVDNKNLTVWVYGLRYDARSRLLDHDWDEDYFEQHLLAQYMKRFSR